MDLQALRYEYKNSTLSEESCACSPFEQFKIWFAESIAAKPPEPNAMILSTVDSAAQPTSRAVLLKGFDENGFVFFTNYASPKGNDLASNNKAALLFYWGELERQVRIEGAVVRVSREISERYFTKRPRGSQLGAACSPQSTPITRAKLEEAYRDLSAQYSGDTPVPCPENWGGFILAPQRIEFWQGRESRLHDRILYRRENDDSWSISRLAP